MGGDYAMRIWMKPDLMARYGLVPSDVSAALSSQNIEASTGAIGPLQPEHRGFHRCYR